MGLPLHQPVTERELLAHPESSLLYPGSLLTRRIGADEHAQPSNREPDPAYAGVIATTSVSATVLLAWYDRKLSARGYLRATYYRPSNQVDGAAWTVPNSNEQVQVGIFASTSQIAGSAPRGELAYEELLVSYRVTGPPPS
jgi:flavin-dependent dehydrogenase